MIKDINLPVYALACLVGVGIGLLCLVSPWLALGLVLVAIVSFAALSKPIVLCYLMIAMLVFTSGMERGRLVPGLKPNEAALLFSAGIAAIVLLANRDRRKSGPRPPARRLSYASIAFPILFVGTVVIPGLSYVLRGATLTAEDVFFLLAPLQYFLLFRVFADLPASEADRRSLLLWMLLCGAAVAAVGLMQAAWVGYVVKFLANWYPSSHEAEAANAGRITSLMIGWNVLGIFMMVNLLIVWALLSSDSQGFRRASLVLPLLLGAACLVATGSFAGVIGLVIGILLIGLLTQTRVRRVPVQIGAVAVVAGAILVFLPLIRPLIHQRLDFQFGHGSIVPSTLTFRFEVWREIFWPVIRQNLLWGTSLKIPAGFAWRWAESEYLLQLFRFGTPGLLAHIAWVSITLGWLYHVLRRTGGLSRSIAVAAFVILVVLSVASLTNEVMTFLGTADYLWILLGLVASSTASARDTVKNRDMTGR